MLTSARICRKWRQLQLLELRHAENSSGGLLVKRGTNRIMGAWIEQPLDLRSIGQL
jgi:hypothetical protein